MGVDVNCKKGDLAIRVGFDRGDAVPLGAIVKCVRFYSGVVAKDSVGRDRFEKDLWLVEWYGNATPLWGGGFGVPDRHLRPIRDPGEDTQDETLSWLPAPSREEETA